MKEKNKKKILIIVLAVIIVIVIAVLILTWGNLFGKDKGKTGDSPTVVPERTESAYKISSNSLENFDLSFLQLENKEENKIYSPLSIKYALEMLKDGTNGTSKAQIDSVIGDYEAKKYDNNEHMSFANAIFIKDSYKKYVNSDYIDNLLAKYNADVIFDSFQNANNLNSWVSDKTFQLVNNLFSDVSNQDYILVNALAIDMEWKKMIQATTNNYEDMFSVSYDHENFGMGISLIEGDEYSSLEFNNGEVNAKAVEIGAAINNYDIVNELGEDNIRKEVGEAYEQWIADGADGCTYEPNTDVYLDSYIKEIDSNYKKYEASTDFMFYDDENVKAFAKDLKEYDGVTLQYISIMPKKSDLSSYIENIEANQINDIITNLKEITPENFKEGVVTKITGYIPLFKFEYELSLMDDLKELGITDVFNSDKADLSNMVEDEKAFINSASHKANIEFSNEGIKAAAATSFGGLGGASCEFVYNYDVPVETIDLTFDNPYLFLIRDKDTGEVWFVGTVYEPISQD